MLEEVMDELAWSIIMYMYVTCGRDKGQYLGGVIAQAVVGVPHSTAVHSHVQ